MLPKWLLLSAAGVSLLACAALPRVSLGQNSSGTAGPGSTRAQVAPDLNDRLAKFRRVSMPFHSQGLTPREQSLVKKLVEASQYLEQIYWRQSDPEGLALLRSLAGSKLPEDVALRRFLTINGSRFDLIRNTSRSWAPRRCRRTMAYIPRV
jgi:hypothetical protein